MRLWNQLCVMSGIFLTKLFPQTLMGNPALTFVAPFSSSSECTHTFIKEGAERNGEMLIFL
ncbi:hypothetical protein BH11VER1_BH11VER1_08740 [soil metagenome]